MSVIAEVIGRGGLLTGSMTKKRDGVYLIRISLGLDPGGKRKYHTETFRGTKKEADSRLRDLLRIHEGGGLIGSEGKMTLNAFLEKWFEESVKSRLKARTLQDYRHVVAHKITNVIGHLQIAKITPLVLQGLYNDLTSRGLAAQTVRNVHTILRGALKQAVRWRIIPYNPAADVDLPRDQGENVVRAMRPEQAHLFMEVIEDDRWGIVLLFGLVTGARPGEYLALQWDDIDLHKRTARIEKSIWWPHGGGWLFDKTKTGKSRRTIPLPDQLVDRLRFWRSRQAQQRQVAGPAWHTEHNFLFTNYDGGPILETNLSGPRCFKKALKKAGLKQQEELARASEAIRNEEAEQGEPGAQWRTEQRIHALVESQKLAELQTTFCLYDLRHTCATLLLLEGVPAKVVSERLGHASVMLTLDTYSHVLPTMQKDATERLGTLLFGIPRI